MTLIAVTHWHLTFADRYMLRQARRHACNDNDPRQLATLWHHFQAALLAFRIRDTGTGS